MDTKKKVDLIKCSCPGCGIMVKAGKPGEPVYCTGEHAAIAKTIREAN